MARPKGYAKWNPSPETLALIGMVQSVLDEYREHLPLTARQIFYRLVGAYGYDKSDLAYSRLCEHLVRARRARLISFESIRDDGTVERERQTFDGVPAFWEFVQGWRDRYSRPRLNGQDVRIELWCEAAGMVPQLQRVAFPYSVPIYSTGGFSSVTVTYEIAQRAMAAEVPTVFLHVGDYDPSGESIFTAMSTDARKFLIEERLMEARKEGTFDELYAEFRTEKRLLTGPELRPIRVALTGEQVEEYDLETAPPKRKDSRSKNWVGETCQAEAMPPDLLASVVTDAIEDVIDRNRYDYERELEEADETLIDEILDFAEQEGQHER